MPFVVDGLQGAVFGDPLPAGIENVEDQQAGAVLLAAHEVLVEGIKSAGELESAALATALQFEIVGLAVAGQGRQSPSFQQLEALGDGIGGLLDKVFRLLPFPPVGPAAHVADGPVGQ